MQRPPSPHLYGYIYNLWPIVRSMIYVWGLIVDIRCDLDSECGQWDSMSNTISIEIFN